MSDQEFQNKINPIVKEQLPERFVRELDKFMSGTAGGSFFKAIPVRGDKNNPERTGKMSGEKLTEAMDVVEEINMEIYELVGNSLDEIDPVLSLNANWYVVSIKFLGSPIWSTEDDRRKYSEEEDGYEPLIDFVRREIQGRITLICQLKNLRV